VRFNSLPRFPSPVFAAQRKPAGIAADGLRAAKLGNLGGWPVRTAFVGSRLRLGMVR
jgi:hypothetical protein